MWSLSPLVVKLTTSPHGKPCNVITVNKSFLTDMSSAASEGVVKHVAVKIVIVRPVTRFFIVSPASGIELDRCELRRVRKNAPDRFARSHDRGCQCWVGVLQKRE